MMDEVPERKPYDEPNPTEAWLAAKMAAQNKQANAGGGDE